MRVGAVPENPLERAASRLNLVPRPLIETQVAYTLARVVMIAVKLGVFEALADGPLSGAQVAERCKTDVRATEKLLLALVGADYLGAKGDSYELTPMTRKWLLQDSDSSLTDKLLLQFFEWDVLEGAEDYVRTGQQVDLHSVLEDDQWRLYQRGMRSLAGIAAPEVAQRLPVPKGAKNMLDIGGSHGYYAVELCRRHEGLTATVLDLPDAVRHAAPLLEAENMGERVVHEPGDARTADLGTDSYDVILTVGVIHHFTEEENRDLAKRVARALRPGGIFAVEYGLRADTPGDAKQIPALLEFWFTFTSPAQTYSPEEMSGWQQEAGLSPQRPMPLRRSPGLGLQVATKSG